MSDLKVDVLIVGGGLTGATLMLALRGLGLSTLLVEAKPFASTIQTDFDARSLALSPATKAVLTMLGCWELLAPYATPIELIHISDQQRFGNARLTGSNANPLGYVIEMQYINRALHQLLAKEELLAPATLIAWDKINHRVTINTPAGEQQISAQLIVAADGAESLMRQFTQTQATIKEYQQHAIVANVGLNKPHANRAYERFTPQGPLALLPMQGNKMSLVWAMPPQQAAAFMTCSDERFLHELQQAFGYRLGRLLKIGTRFSYPLKQVLTNQQASWPIVFVGNAAHTLHPVAGQGFNLGLRDVAMLAQCIAQQGLNQLMLDNYLQARRHDQWMITHFTDGLIKLFTSRIPGIGLARNLGLIAMDNSALLKRLLARYAQGFGGVIPDLVCEIALTNRELP
ncbi:MAG: 2-octaprenyl-6-methoxyphenyl hydroxylase [bacterium]|nr:2-octaprenyl-6-methoxyphenyl hydroxylase [bacterium]